MIDYRLWSPEGQEKLRRQHECENDCSLPGVAREVCRLIEQLPHGSGIRKESTGYSDWYEYDYPKYDKRYGTLVRAHTLPELLRQIEGLGKEEER